MSQSAHDPELATALQEEPGWVPVEHDWSFRADRPQGGFNRYGWGRADQARFDACWDADVDVLANDLIAAYGAMWPWAMPRLALARHPRFAACVRGLAERQEVGKSHTYSGHPDIIYEHAMMYGSFDHVRLKRGPAAWPPAPQLACPICGASFWTAILSPWMLRQYGPPRYCNRCCVRARNGRTRGGGDAALDGVRRLAAAIEGIPEQGLAQHISLGGVANDRRDAIMVGLIVAPAATYARKQIGGTWLQVLQASGLVGEAWRPARGTYCVAMDGHPCRSLAERTVDDFLSTHGMAHDTEPPYPGSTRRADWRLADGTLVEYAGLLGDNEYAAKITEKRAIAAAAGVRLMILVPEDLTSLEHAFGAWLAT
ncbi:MAG: hypothetical protein ABSD62_14780 [Candidatus Limnocylindrales bacterium]|jgi:hypothetical protein